MYELIILKESQKIDFCIEEDTELFVLCNESSKSSITLDLKKAGISIIVNGIIIGHDNSDIELNIKSIHSKPSTFSRIYVKSYLTDSSKFKFKGMIETSKTAQLSDAYLKNISLLASGGAKVESIPQLEIKADNVKASHGVVGTSFNQNELFYLMSRGINLNDSKKLIIKGFLDDIIQKIGNNGLSLRVKTVKPEIYEYI